MKNQVQNMKKSLLSGKLQKDKIQNDITPEQVEQMHKQVLAKTGSSDMPTEKPTIEAEAVLPIEEKAPKVRLSIDVTKDMHKKMKKRIADTEQTLIDYVVQLIAKDLE